MLTQPSTGRAVLGILRGRTAAPPAAPQQRATLGAFTLGTGTRQAGPTTVLEHDRHDYTVNAAAYRAAEYVASNLASVDLTVARPDGSVNDQHPVARLWNQGTPGASFSARTARHVLFLRAELAGESMAYIDRGPTGTGDPVGMYPILDPVEVHLVRDENTRQDRVAGFVVLQGRLTGGVQARVPLLPSEVLWLRYPHPFKAWESLAPWRAALHAVEADHWARAWQLGEFKNGARPSHVIDLGAVSDETDANARAAYRSEIEGPGNAGKALIISASEDAMGDGGRAPSVHRLSLTPAEMSYLESRTRNDTEVFLAWGLRTDLFMGQATYENQRAAKVAAWSDRLLPALDVLGSELDRQLLPSDTEEAAWDLSQIEALRENADAIAARVRQIAPTDTLLLDEMRDQMGYGPLPGGMGQLTLTAYRARLSVDTAQAMADAGLNAPSTAAEQGRMLRVSVRARTITHRPTRAAITALPATATRAALSAKRVLALYDRHERAGVKAVKRLAGRQEKAVLRELRKVMRLHAGETTVRVRAGDVFDQTYWAGETALAFEPFLEAVWGEGGQRTADALGVDYDDPMTARVLEAMATRRDVLASQVTATTRAVLESQLLQGAVEQGESVDQIADRIRSVFTTLSSSRAETIARTEVVGGYSAASFEVANVSGLQVEKVWLATDDDDTRKSHRHLDGARAKMDARFSNGLMFPGDPSGKPAETVNCRCVLLYEE